MLLSQARYWRIIQLFGLLLCASWGDGGRRCASLNIHLLLDEIEARKSELVRGEDQQHSLGKRLFLALRVPIHIPHRRLMMLPICFLAKNAPTLMQGDENFQTRQRTNQVVGIAPHHGGKKPQTRHGPVCDRPSYSRAAFDFVWPDHIRGARHPV